MKKIALIILDWVWINNKTPNENVFYNGKFPTFEYLFKNLKTSLDASWLSVWIPDWQMWNSEVGHMTIWAGKIIRQNTVKIDEMFEKKEFQLWDEFKNGIKNKNVHIITLFWNGWVHSSQNHLTEILKIIPSEININLHLFADGRDLAPKSFLKDFEIFEKDILSQYKNVVVSSISGRYFGMDRDNNWDRIEFSYNEMVYRKNISKLDVKTFIQNGYNQWINDEFIKPTSFFSWKSIQDNESVFFLNFRSDRAKQITKTFVDTDFNEFQTKKFENLYFVTMTKYYDEYVWEIFIEDDKIENVLGFILSQNNKTQLHLAETEKFAHVTKFFNGWVNTKFDKETDILIPSHKVATYDLDPEMSAGEIFQSFQENVLNYDFSVVNFANWDMVGHTWNMDAVVKSIKKIDDIVKELIEFCNRNQIELLITADHWNCEEMGDSLNPKTSHSTNLVPFWYISEWKIIHTKSNWWLYNIAPTVLDIMWINMPDWMEKSLL